MPEGRVVVPKLGPWRPSDAPLVEGFSIPQWKSTPLVPHSPYAAITAEVFVSSHGEPQMFKCAYGLSANITIVPASRIIGQVLFWVIEIQ
jgi:hypothetical protein